MIPWKKIPPITITPMGRSFVLKMCDTAEDTQVASKKEDKNILLELHHTVSNRFVGYRLGYKRTPAPAFDDYYLYLFYSKERKTYMKDQKLNVFFEDDNVRLLSFGTNIVKTNYLFVVRKVPYGPKEE